jgi:hypothetical protein
MLNRLAQHFEGRTFDQISIEDMNGYIIYLKKDRSLASETCSSDIETAVYNPSATL